MKLKSINPCTEEVNWAHDPFSIGECIARIGRPRAAFSVWVYCLQRKRQNILKLLPRFFGRELLLLTDKQGL